MKGSISVFLAYLLVFILAVVFALLEVSRVWGLDQRANIDATMSQNSLLAGYSKELWEQYGLLFIDGSNGQGALDLSELEMCCLTYSMENMDLHGGETGQVSGQTWNLYGLKPTDVSLSVYGLATDQGGTPFRQEAVTYMESQVTEIALQGLYDTIVQKEETSLPEIDVQETSKEITLTENPIDVVEQMKQRDLLSLVTNETDVSNKTIDLTDALSVRVLEKGNSHIQISDLVPVSSVEWKDKLLFRMYLERYFPCYVNCQGTHSLDYEMEYLVIGKASDRENLQGVVGQLLVMRELANLQFLKTNAAKQEIILAAASGLAAATLSPELIPAYKAGIMAAWAYAEAVFDVRLLLDGQKVSMIKTEEQWHTDLDGLATGTANIQQSQGMSYQQYLQLLLWTKQDELLAYRAMDLIEKNTGYNMNHQIYYLEGRISYQGSPLFTSLITIGKGWNKGYEFQKPLKATYIGYRAVFLYSKFKGEFSYWANTRPPMA